MYVRPSDASLSADVTTLLLTPSCRHVWHPDLPDFRVCYTCLGAFASARLSVRPHETARLLLDGFS